MGPKAWGQCLPQRRSKSDTISRRWAGCGGSYQVRHSTRPEQGMSSLILCGSGPGRAAPTECGAHSDRSSGNSHPWGEASGSHARPPHSPDRPSPGEKESQPAAEGFRCRTVSRRSGQQCEVGARQVGTLWRALRGRSVPGRHAPVSSARSEHAEAAHWSTVLGRSAPSRHIGRICLAR